MKYTKEYIRTLLEQSDAAVLKGLLRVYSLQTVAERNAEHNTLHNGVGFSSFDAKFLTSLAKSYIKYGRLTEKQMVFARKKMIRYAGQLARVANGEIICPPLPGIRYSGGQVIDQPEKIIVVPVPSNYEDEERKAIQEIDAPLPKLEW